MHLRHFFAILIQDMFRQDSLHILFLSLHKCMCACSVVFHFLQPYEL